MNLSTMFLADETDTIHEAEAREPETTPVSASKEKTHEEAYSELQQQYLRLAADFDNFRKRTAQERESLFKYGAASTIEAILPVIDNLERAEKSLNEKTDMKTFMQSFRMMHQQLMDVLKSLGVSVIESEGKQFNPEHHEALSQQPNSEHPENTIVEVYQQGYKLHDKVIRVARVVVAIPAQGEDA